MFKSYFLFALLAFTHTIATAQPEKVLDPFSLIRESISLIYVGDLENSQKLFSKGILLFEGNLTDTNKANWYNAHLEYGELLMHNDHYQLGKEIFLKMDSLFEDAPRRYIKFRIKNNVGFALSVLQRDREAVPYLLEGLAIGKPESSRDSLYSARLHNNLSVSYEILDVKDESIKHMLEAIRLYELIGDTYSLSIAWNNLSYNYRHLNLFEKGEEAIRKSIQYAELQPDDKHLLAKPYNVLATLRKQNGDLDGALTYLNKALEASKLGDSKALRADPLYNIGLLYSEVGETDKARSFFNRAIQITRGLGLHIATALIHKSISDTYVSDRNFEQASLHLDLAFSAAKKLDDSVEGLFELNMARAQLLIEIGNYPEAIAFANTLIEQVHTTPEAELDIQRLLASIYALQGDYKTSLIHHRAVASLTNKDPLTSKLDGLVKLSIAYQAVENDSSFIIAESAFELIERLRSSVRGAFRIGIFSNFSEYYNEVAIWYLEQGNAERAFALFGKARARTFLEELNRTNEKLFSSMADSLLIQKRERERTLDNLYDAFLQEENVATKDSLNRALSDLEFKYESFLQTYKNTLRPTETVTTPLIPDLVSVQSSLSHQDAIASFSIVKNQLVTMFITNKDVHYSTSTKVPDLNLHLGNLIAEYRASISEKKSLEQLAKLSKPITDILFRDIPIDKPSIQNLIVIPDGALSLLPFDALVYNDSFLINKWLIKRLPSMSIYKNIHRARDSYNNDLLALASPGSVIFKDSLGENTRNDGSGIPFTLTEVREISRLVPRSKIMAPSINELELKSMDLTLYKYIHFATHGEIHIERPQQSGLHLAYGSSSGDGFLNSGEIAALNISSDMVVLSACNTGNGSYISGEGLLGLQRSFLIAGASSVVVSLWDIPDKSTALFMIDFYRNLPFFEQRDNRWWQKTKRWFSGNEQPLFDYKAKALRQAKLNMLEDPYYSHPVYWAPFVYIGK